MQNYRYGSVHWSQWLHVERHAVGQGHAYACIATGPCCCVWRSRICPLEHTVSPGLILCENTIRVCVCQRLGIVALLKRKAMLVCTNRRTQVTPATIKA